MNSQTFSVLEFSRMKEEVAQFALTDSGKEHVKAIVPSTHRKQIQSLLDEVTEAKQIFKANKRPQPCPA
ncbi:hypothetical protein J9303_14840 [Bacillaceae bacterium Marseille-Q3522]|nr:hypothetical protein [Bacillaceae bacterium Marseille-Q3522]